VYSEPEEIQPRPAYAEEPPCSPHFDHTSTEYSDALSPDADLMFEAEWIQEAADNFEDNQTLADGDSEDHEPPSPTEEDKTLSNYSGAREPESGPTKYFSDAEDRTEDRGDPCFEEQGVK
jgi:hypothetical protein